MHYRCTADALRVQALTRLMGGHSGGRRLPVAAEVAAVEGSDMARVEAANAAEAAEAAIAAVATEAAGAAAPHARLRRWWGDAASVAYHTAPCWSVLLLFALVLCHQPPAAIGHRFLLSLHPALYILLGGAVASASPGARWHARGGRSSGSGSSDSVPPSLPLAVAGAVALLVVLLLLESLACHPNYLAYFSPTAGGSAAGHFHLLRALHGSNHTPLPKPSLESDRHPKPKHAQARVDAHAHVQAQALDPIPNPKSQREPKLALSPQPRPRPHHCV